MINGTAPLELLAHIQARTADALRALRRTVPVGPFLAGLHPNSDLVWVNYALPLRPLAPGEVTPELLGQLREEFRRHGRRLRFEFFEALHPGLAADLERGGLQLQLRIPLMLCAPGAVRERPAVGVELVRLRGDEPDELLREFLHVARQSFGQPGEPEPHEVPELRDHLGLGRMRGALARVAGRVAGVATLVTSNDELAGVGTLPEFRRRGIASHLSAVLVAEHFARGARLAWLSAGDAAAHAVYTQVGFRDGGAQLNYIDPDVPAGVQ